MAKDINVTMADLHVQMKITNKLLSAQLREKLSQQELIQLLSKTGATDGEIADILGTTAATVNTTRQRLKKKDKK